MGVTPGRWIRMGWEIFTQDIGNFVLMTVVAFALWSFGHFVVAGPLLVGLFIAARRRILESRSDFMDVFAGFSFFVDAFLVYVIKSVFEIVGLALCVVPFFIIAALYLFAYLFVLDRRLSFWDAMEASRKVVVENLLGYVMFVVLLLLLNVLGLILLVVGLFVTIPVSIAAIAVAYQEKVGFQYRPAAPSPPIVIP